MEVITFESKAFKALEKKIDAIERKVDSIASFVFKAAQDKQNDEDIWLDNAEVSRILNISTKTLQRLRKDNMISFTLFRGKIKYKASDISKYLDDFTIKTDPRVIEEFRRNFIYQSNDK